MELTLLGVLNCILALKHNTFSDMYLTLHHMHHRHDIQNDLRQKNGIYLVCIIYWNLPVILNAFIDLTRSECEELSKVGIVCSAY